MKSFRRYILIGLLLYTGAGVRGQSFGKVGYAPIPNDPYWHVPEENFQQWYLENRGTNGVRTGGDTNAREAWASTKGAGIVIAIVDDGVDLEHPDLEGQFADEVHYNFEFNTTDGHHPVEWFAHGTPVAGLAAARANNGRGVAGLAPEAKIASWVIYQTNSLFVNANGLAKMFETHLDKVSVQNHSWFKGGSRLTPMSAVEDAAIARAVTEGRGGKGIVIVRAGGNGRLDGRNANEDAYANDPRVITVAALEKSGAFTVYSNPGACILVSAPGGTQEQSIFTTDRQGTLGYNQINFDNDLADYLFHSLGFRGTSASSPLIAATAALVLSTNPNVHYRDVQQIMIHAANPSEPEDPDALPNGAGYVVSHHSGFGNVDAGRAVELAKRWVSRPPKTIVRHGANGSQPIVDGGLTLDVTGPNLPANLARMPAAPSMSVHAEAGTPALPLVHVGLATEDITVDLNGKGALIQRGGGAHFSAKLRRAAAAGAEFAIMYNNQGGDALQIMGETELVPIPAIFIGQNHGEALVEYIQANPEARAQINHQRVSYAIEVPETLLCEHVGLRVRANHARRGDVRITLVSPAGTTSVMQPLGADDQGGPTNWVYYSTHHFYESSKGLWRVFVADQIAGNTGTVEEAEIIVHGVELQDFDADGLQDTWEQQFFGSLSHGPRDDPDQDGVINSREQILGTAPNAHSIPFIVSVAPWKPGYLWMSWPSPDGPSYTVNARVDITAPRSDIGSVPGEGHRSSVVLPTTEAAAAFFQISRP